MLLNSISSLICYLILILPLADEIVDCQPLTANRQLSTVNRQPSTFTALVGK
ncbi:MAG: hypothetical protein KME64_37140 [Scytonematopsis contorta HA4267-MV1]|nr:hypothetical protein [Scytonematopsis contorta HA4267-MV1]